MSFTSELWKPHFIICAVNASWSLSDVKGCHMGYDHEEAESLGPLHCVRCGGLRLDVRSRGSVGRISLGLVRWRRWSGCRESQGAQLSMSCPPLGPRAWPFAICRSTFMSRSPLEGAHIHILQMGKVRLKQGKVTELVIGYLLLCNQSHQAWWPKDS